MTDITIENNGLRLAASIYGPAAAEPILFLHGLSSSRDTWNEVAQSMSSEYCVWTLDFRGHGHSDRSSSYEIADYVSDAETALAEIAKPAIIVGHSLGACVAGVLAQSGNLNVRGVFLEDPPWFLGEPGEHERSAFSKLFPILSAKQASLQHERATLAKYLEFFSSLPSPMGGIASDHLRPRHLLSQASSLQRQDNRCWENVPAILGAIETGREFRCPAKIIQADPRFGAALLDGHEARLARTNPKAEIVRYGDCSHSPHRTLVFEERFARDLIAFLSSFVARSHQTGGSG